MYRLSFNIYMLKDYTVFQQYGKPSYLAECLEYRPLTEMNVRPNNDNEKLLEPNLSHQLSSNREHILNTTYGNPLLRGTFGNVLST